MKHPALRASGSDGGYALLALLASAAMLLASLALSLPRLAMQSQRTREETLIGRGEQYQRAIKLYFREHRKYPRELEDLEDTDGVRYLRGGHGDPMGETGEWRIIHMGTDGRFEDSLLFDLAKPGSGEGFSGFQGGARAMTGDPGRQPPPQQLTPGMQPAYLPEGAGLPGTAEGPQPLVGAARARTIRESAAPAAIRRGRYSQGFSFDTSEAADQRREDPSDSERADVSRMLPSLVPMDENDPGPGNPDSEAGLMGGAGPFGTAPGGEAPPGFPRVVDPREPPRATGNPLGQATGSGAAGLINRLLTSPRPGGLQGQAGTQAPAVQAQMFERGIAGVASTSEEVGVKVYAGEEQFNRWEFVYDYRKDPALEAGEGGSRTPSSAAGTLPTGRQLSPRQNRR